MRITLVLGILSILGFNNIYSQNGFIRGKVFDESLGEEIIGANVIVQINDFPYGTSTDLDGKFNLEIPAGTHTVKISYIAYAEKVIEGVVVKNGEVTPLGDIGIVEASIGLKDVVITASAVRNTETALLSMKMKSANLLDGISASNLKLTGDSDAASSMKRVSGVSVQGGKYVYVRGLGDRYTKTMLNGLDIPGLDPDRNSLQMDIFPTSIIDNIIVHKSFSAELPADFTGGIIDIETSDFPEKKESKISINAGYNPAMHFNKDYLSYEGGKMDFLGFDDGARKMPATENIPDKVYAISDINKENPELNGPDAVRYKEILNSFNPIMAASKQMSLADIGFSISTGNQVPKEKCTVGYNFALSYKNSTTFYKNTINANYGLSSDASKYEMEQRVLQTGNLGENNVLVSALAGIAIKTYKSKYRFNLLHLQNGESSSGIFNYTKANQGSVFYSYQHNLAYSQRSISNILIDGQHFFDKSSWKINWKVSPTLSIVQDPDIRFARYEINTEGNLVGLGTEVGIPTRTWRELQELNVSSVVHFTKEFKFNGTKGKMSFGGANTYKQRDYIIRIISIEPLYLDNLTGNPNEFLTNENLWTLTTTTPDGTYFSVDFIPTNPNQYSANVLYSAAYLSTELQLLKKLKAVAGARVENYIQHYTGQNQLGSILYENEEVLNDFGLFPSLNLNYNLSEKQNLRFSYTQTIARPSFKELSFAEIQDPISGNTFIGAFHVDGKNLTDNDPSNDIVYWDGNLKSTHIQNVDLRWETFFRGNQMLSLSAFYKKFKDPIEIVQYTVQPGSYQPRNVGDGQIFGTELEFRFNFSFLSKELEKFSINTNFTYTESQIKLSIEEMRSREDNKREGQTINEYREMAGQAPYIINSGIAYSGAKDGFFKGFNAGFYYNVQGETLYYVGIVDRPDIYTKPFHSLNFNSSKKFGKNEKMQFGLKVSNIMNQSKELVYKSFKAEDKIYKSRMPGTSFSFKFGYSF